MNALGPSSSEPGSNAPVYETLWPAARVDPLVFARRVVGMYLTAGPDHPYPGAALLLRSLGVAVNKERAPGIRFRKISMVAAARDRNWIEAEVDMPDKTLFQVFGFLSTPSKDETVEHPQLTEFLHYAASKPAQDPIAVWSRTGFLIGARGPAARKLLDVLAEGSENADLAIWSDGWLRPDATGKGIAIARPSLMDTYASLYTKRAEAPPADLAERLIATKKFSAIKRISALDTKGVKTRYNSLFTLTPADGVNPAFTATVEQLEDWLRRLAEQEAQSR